MLCVVDCSNFWSPSGGGVRRYHIEKIDYYTQRGDVNYIFIMHDEKTYTEKINDTTTIEHLKVPKVFGNWEYRYLTRQGPIKDLLIKLNPDIIEIASPYFLPRIIHKIVTKHNLKSKVFGFWHADFPVTYVKTFLSKWPSFIASAGENKAWAFARKHYNRMEGVLASSNVIIDRMKKNGIEDIHYVPLGVETKLFAPSKADPALKKEIQDGEKDRLVMFFPHRFSNEKGIETLLKAYDIVREKLDHEPALIIAGTGPLQPLVEEYSKKYQHIKFIGFIKEKETMAKYFATADLGFALSSWETFGLSLLESLSSGLPLIAASEGAAGEHINRSGAGYILENNTAEHLADTIFEYERATNKDHLKSLAVSYADGFSWEKCFDKQLAVYKSSLG